MNWYKPLAPQQVAQHFDRYFQKIERRQAPKATAIRVYSQKLGLDYTYPAESACRPFHVASIGKLFTATLVQQLAERGVLALSDPIYPFFAPGDLERLFFYREVDYARQVTIEQLLSHTSGIADYIEDRTTSGKTMLDDILANPSYHWTPQTLLAFTSQNQQAVGAPGSKFHYSDTGYILLGLIIEKLTGKPFDQQLAEEIFQPLEMDDSYLMFYGEPKHTPKPPIEKIWFNDAEISGYESLSCDWAGGGVISTTEDLLKFSLALRSGRLIRLETLASMERCNNRFQPGIYYGVGMMEIRFKDFFFLLGSLPKVKGHIGILATHLFYDPLHEAHIVMNFGSNKRMVESFQALIEIENVLQKLQTVN